MAVQSRQKTQASETLRALVAVGLILGLIGGVITAVAWPEANISSLGHEEHGSRFWAAIGVLTAWLGNAMLFVGLIGYGVKIGREASPSAVEATD